MFKYSRQTVCTKIGFALMIVLTASCQLFANNTITLKRASSNVIALDLSNSDQIAGFQFSINARGAVALRSLEGESRASAAGLEIHQYLINDSTLNIVLLAPFRSSLPAGQGTIATVSYGFCSGVSADSVRIFLTGVKICSVDAQLLQVTTEELCWNLRENNNAHRSNFTLEQNFPNPFNPSTTITYDLQTSAHVRLAIYDITGREVKSVVDQAQSSGRYSVRWDAENQGGSKLASGVYIARLQVDGQVAIRKMIYTK